MRARRVLRGGAACAVAAFAAFTAIAAAGSAGAATSYPPTAIAVDGSGVSYVGDGTTGSIRRYASDGTPLASWGTFGAGPGQIQGVIDLDVDDQGVVWVLELRNRLQAFTTSGTLLREVELGACSKGNPPFAPGFGGVEGTPEGVWVASPCADRVTRYRRDLSGTDRTFAVPSPTGIAIRGDSVYVGRRGPGDVQVRGFDGTLRRTFTLPAEPWDLFVDTFDVLHVSTPSTSNIRLFGSDGVEFRTLGRPGAGPGDLTRAYRFDVGAQGAGSIAGDLFIADHGNNRIRRWNSFGSTLFARPNDAPGSSGPGDPPPPPPPPATRTGVTIDDAAAFTASRSVTLRIVPPTGATGVVLANDGGFGDASERPIAASGQYAWTLRSSGADRLPKTVYVRFTGGGVDADRTFTDDIVLDDTGATVTRATFRTLGARSAATGRGPVARLTVRARDDNSGVRALAVSSRPGGGRTAYVRNRRSFTVRLDASRRVYVRAIDRAGNAGRWVRARRAG